MIDGIDLEGTYEIVPARVLEKKELRVKALNDTMAYRIDRCCVDCAATAKHAPIEVAKLRSA